MKRKISFAFLKPRWLNVFLTIFVLCLPILREQYIEPSGKILVTWYRPLFVFVSYLQKPQQYQPFLIMIGLTLLIYLVVSVVIAGIFILVRMKKDWPLGFLGFLGFLGIPGIFTQDWKDLLWLVWFIWFLYFIPQKKT